MRTKANKRSCHYKRIALAKTMPTKIAIGQNVAEKRKGKSTEIRKEREKKQRKKINTNTVNHQHSDIVPNKWRIHIHLLSIWWSSLFYASVPQFMVIVK